MHRCGRAAARLATGVILAAGCASTPPSSLVDPDLLVALRVAGELERAVHLDPARRQLALVAEQAPPEIADESRLRLCATWGREGAAAEAQRCYTELATGLQTSNGRALAELYAAVTSLERGEPEAEARLAAILTHYPGEAAARRAVRICRELARERGGAAAELEVLLSTASKLRTAAEAGSAGETELYLESAIEAAALAVTLPGRAAESLAWLAAAEPLMKTGRWRDDLLWWRSRALFVLGRDDEAIAALRTLIDARVSSWFVGSYDSPYLDDALLSVAQAEERRGRIDEAVRGYQRLLEETPDSRLCDDAAFAAARLLAAGGDRAPLERFVHNYPESRHLPAARGLLGVAP